MLCVELVCRPAAAISTMLFGQHWSTPGMQEIGFSVPATVVTTVQQLMALLTDKLHIHPVETIAACTF